MVLTATRPSKWTKRPRTRWAASRAVISKTEKLYWTTFWRWCAISSPRSTPITALPDKPCTPLHHFNKKHWGKDHHCKTVKMFQPCIRVNLLIKQIVVMVWIVRLLFVYHISKIPPGFSRFSILPNDKCTIGSTCCSFRLIIFIFILFDDNGGLAVVQCMSSSVCSWTCRIISFLFGCNISTYICLCIFLCCVLFILIVKSFISLLNNYRTLEKRFSCKP